MCEIKLGISFVRFTTSIICMPCSVERVCRRFVSCWRASLSRPMYGLSRMRRRGCEKIEEAMTSLRSSPLDNRMTYLSSIVSRPKSE